MSSNRRRKFPLLPLTVLVLTVVLSIAIVPVESAIELPQALKPFALPLLLSLTIIWCLIAIWQYFLQGEPEEQNQNRQRLLDRVHMSWIEGVLDQSLYGAAQFTLGLQEQPGMSDNPWQLVLQQMDQPAQALPEGTHIMQVYDQAEGKLLILGEPGAGKTTMLLELARDLLRRAEDDKRHPMPVVFNLSSWAVKRQPLSDWLVEEMSIKYQVPHKLAQAWVDADQVLPLLDGFDEAAEAYHTACAEAISTFRQTHHLPLVVCSRSAQSLPLKQQVRFRLIVEVQPLTTGQIDQYLTSAGEQMEAARLALHTDLELRELVTTPFMLSVLLLAYHGRSDPVRFTGGSLETRQQQLFEEYVQAMLKRRRAETRYTPRLSMHWLAWLAQQMAKHSQTEFYIERMQMDWLPEGQPRRLYHSIFVGLIYGLLIGLAHWMISGNIIGLDNKLPFRLGVGLIAGLVFGLGFGLFSKQDIEIKPAEAVVWSWTSMRQNIVKSLRSRLMVGLLVGLLNGLIVGLALWWQLHLFWPDDLGFGLIFGSLFWLGFELLGKLGVEIKPAEAVVWSWTSMRQNMVKFLRSRLIVGLVVGLVVGVGFWLFNGWLFGLIIGPATGLLTMLLIGLISGLVGGLSNELLDEQSHITPNQGIWRSAQNGILIGLVAGLVFGSVYGLGFGLYFRIFFGKPLLSYILRYGLTVGPTTGLIFGLRSGGVACIQHMILRVLLWHTRSIPWNYPRFLDFAAERFLLRKVGAGYIFMHRLLLDYFASLGTIPATEKSPAHVPSG